MRHGQVAGKPDSLESNCRDSRGARNGILALVTGPCYPPQLPCCPPQPPAPCSQVGFVQRRDRRTILNLDDVMEQCKQWAPPPGSNYTRAECHVLPEFDALHFAQQLAELQTYSVMVRSGVGFVLVGILLCCVCHGA